ncbi:Protein TOXD 3 [Pleurostoma richardsiae]|uniref:Protein TOXD 3 n=1 Tax=Pleurostoma richardsiae TaxID=41990 RepID=A0AA38RL90_9PEZI|nr:Protein TOXD 3 [Pleurostoma richardsiae]
MRALVAKRLLITRVLNLSLGKSLGRGCEIKDVRKLSIDDHDILVRVKVVALNPTDYKHIDVVSPPNSIIGCDYAGVVIEVGKKAPGQWRVGDRVAGAVHGGLYPDRGAFAEYLKIDGDLAWKIPSEMSDEDATTYGISAITAMLAVNVHLGIPWADEVDKTGQDAASKGLPVFIYSGATSAGLFAIQLAKAAGCTVVTTASPRSFDLVKRYGADRVFDYRSSTAVADIVREFPNITAAVDCFSEGNSTEFCASVLKNKGGKVVTLLDRGKSKIRGVEYELVMAYTLFGRPFVWLPPIGPKFEASPSDRKALARFYAGLPRLTKDVKPVPTHHIDGGFDGILVGLDKLRKGEASGGKFVVPF